MNPKDGSQESQPGAAVHGSEERDRKTIAGKLLGFMGILAIFLVVAWTRAREASTTTSPTANPTTAFEPTKSRIAEGMAEGKTKLSPSDMDAAAIGKYDLIFTVGPSGIAQGGGIMAAFPKAWFTNPLPIPKALQQNNPDAPHYAGVQSSRVASKLTMKIDNVNLDGKRERFSRTMLVTLEGEPMKEGDEITVSLSNTTCPFLTGQDEVAVAVDAKGDGQFRKIKSGAKYEVFSGAGEEMVLIGPSQAVIGQQVELHLTAFDRFYNVAETFAGPIEVKGIKAPPNLEFGSLDRAHVVIPWTPDKEGFYWPEATATIFINQTGTFKMQRFVALGNPIRVFAKEPETKIYWGDLHAHSHISKDGIGKNDFGYARDAAHLDFFASTEHADDDGNPLADGITPAEWEEIKANVRNYYKPGKFATLLAFECSMGAPSGHHNVFFRSLDGVPLASRKMKTEAGLWAMLKEGEAITIPHHLGIAWSGEYPAERSAGPGLQKVPPNRNPKSGGPAVDWGRPDNNALRPLLEIYSMHGQSEYFDPKDPLAYENAGFTSARSQEGKHYARDAWEMGRSEGVAAATDNHTAHPGLRQGGATAVRAPELTREAIFDGLKSRFTYATTGERIYMDFHLAGVRMGQRTNKFSEDSLHCEVTLAAPTPIDYAELLMIDWTSGEYSTVRRWDKPGKLVDEKFDIPNSFFGAMYYLRAELVDKVRDRPVRAWSSPIWVDP